SAGGVADLSSTAGRHAGRNRKRGIHHLPPSRSYRATAGWDRERLFAAREQAVNRLAIIGGGSWGTALSIVLAPRFSEVRLWVYEHDLAGLMSISRDNDVYLPGFSLPSNVTVVTDFAAALEGAVIVLGVM